jgi:hypothetical protein
MKKYKFDAHLHLRLPSGKNIMHVHNTPHTSHAAIKMHYYSSSHHFRTEASLIKIKKVVPAAFKTIAKAGKQVKAKYVAGVPQHGMLDPKSYHFKWGK